MTISVKKIKGTKVYLNEASQPWGAIENVIFDRENKKVSAFSVKTLSIVPICKVVEKSSVENLDSDKMILKKNAPILNFEKYSTDKVSGIALDTVKTAVSPGGFRKKLKDIRFDFETGEMSDMVISENIIVGKRRISVNKISLKDNTIYVEN